MEKNYVLEYIPIPGRLKRGVYVVFPPLGAMQLISYNKETREWTGKHLYNDGQSTFKPTKYVQPRMPFLCTKNLQPGDEYWMDEWMGKALYCKKGIFQAGEKLEDAVKVIGYISGEALLFAQDMGEFGEDEIKIIPGKDFIKIKGPCGHFH